jgi:hypothetical protein
MVTPVRPNVGFIPVEVSFAFVVLTAMVIFPFFHVYISYKVPNISRYGVIASSLSILPVRKG